MDKFCIGEAAYHELTCCPGGEELPRSYLVKQCKENLNKLCSIESTPGEANRAAFDFHDELSTVIEEMVSFILKYSYHGQTYCCLAQYSHSELGPDNVQIVRDSMNIIKTFTHATTFNFQIEANEELGNTVIKVKISGDGAKMTRLTNFIIISFSILNAEDTVMSSKGIPL